MATIDWPTGHHWEPGNAVLGVRVPKSGWSAFFTGQQQTVSHLADRLRLVLRLKPCGPDEAAEREAYCLSLVSTGDWVRLGHPTRSIPRGTMRGTPVIGAAAAAGARTVTIETTAGATLLAGDVVGVAGQLLPAAYAGAVANGSGVMTLPLSLPLRVALSDAAAVTWQAPTGTFQLEADSVDLSYGRSQWQGEIELAFREVF